MRNKGRGGDKEKGYIPNVYSHWEHPYVQIDVCIKEPRPCEDPQSVLAIVCVKLPCFPK